MRRRCDDLWAWGEPGAKESLDFIILPGNGPNDLPDGRFGIDATALAV